jgi:truncated hemoglobin YjbI
LPDEELRQPWLTNAADAVAKAIIDRPAHPYLFGALYHAAHGLGVYRARLERPAPSR